MHMKYLIPVVAASAALFVSAQANADVMGELVSGSGSAGTSSWSDVHGDVVGGSGYTKGNGLTYPPGTSYTSYTVSNATATTQAGGLAALDTVTWHLAFANPWNLDSFSIRFDREAISGQAGPAAIAVQLSVNGGSFVDVLTDTTVSTTGEEHLNVSLAAFDNVTNATFRAILWNGTTSGQFDFENSANIGGASFQLNASPIPEPASVGLLGLAGLALLRRRR
jgi:hypothetical protein